MTPQLTPMTVEDDNTKTKREHATRRGANAADLRHYYTTPLRHDYTMTLLLLDNTARPEYYTATRRH